MNPNACKFVAAKNAKDSAIRATVPFVLPYHSCQSPIGYSTSQNETLEAIEASLERLMSIEPLIFAPEEEAERNAAEADLELGRLGWLAYAGKL